ncbi:class I fructose-bisphosphate aldolase [Inquilinus sp. OTU3971]|uniref:class I fructose-bisphosphate aldolase n=1 Tax=Inquilinus sp. OTU3971 TaxID=3043855 RepID=UPI00313F0FC4
MDRLFGESGRCLDVAIDHGMVNELPLLAGVEDMLRAVAVLVKAAPDAIQLAPGMVHALDGVRGRSRPALVLRSDTSNVYGATLPRHLFSETNPAAVELAVSADAACVVVNHLLLPNQPELHHQTLRNVMALKRQCERSGMPLMVEPLVMAPNDAKGGYMVDGNLSLILPLVRQAVELGADIIKADPCENPQEFHRIVETAAGVPVLVRGGGRAGDEEILTRTVEIMKQGARGIVYGRNIIQHAHPDRMVRALMAVVHHGAGSSAALEILAHR